MLPKKDSTVLSQFGFEINCRFEHPLIQVCGSGSNISILAKRAIKVNQVVIQEDIKNGEHIRSYRLMVKSKGGWQVICRGSAIGHKRIQQFPTVTGKAFRLEVLKSDGRPLFKEIALYCVGESSMTKLPAVH